MEYRSAIVTGGAQGLGRGLATALVDRGTRVTICDVNPEVMNVAGELGPLATGVVADVADSQSARVATRAAIDHGGTIDLLINNVGVNPHTEIDAELEAVAEAFDSTIAANLRSAVLFSRAALDAMRSNGGGAILNISTDHVHTCGWPDEIVHDDASPCPFSAEPRPPWGGWSWLFLYDISKWGLNGLTNVWSRSLAGDGISINNFCLGTIDSARVRSHYTAESMPDWADTWMPLEQIVPVILKLLDEDPPRSGDNVGLWCGHPLSLSPPGRQAFVLERAR